MNNLIRCKCSRWILFCKIVMLLCCLWDISLLLLICLRKCPKDCFCHMDPKIWGLQFCNISYVVKSCFNKIIQLGFKGFTVSITVTLHFFLGSEMDFSLKNEMKIVNNKCFVCVFVCLFKTCPTHSIDPQHPCNDALVPEMICKKWQQWIVNGLPLSAFVSMTPRNLDVPNFQAASLHRWPDLSYQRALGEAKYKSKHNSKMTHSTSH